MGVFKIGKRIGVGEVLRSLYYLVNLALFGEFLDEFFCGTILTDEEIVIFHDLFRRQSFVLEFEPGVLHFPPEVGHQVAHFMLYLILYLVDLCVDQVDLLQ